MLLNSPQGKAKIHVQFDQQNDQQLFLAEEVANNSADHKLQIEESRSAKSAAETLTTF